MNDSVCFTGHREVPAADREKLARLLPMALRQCIGRGYRRFWCGGALGFDTLAALAVLREKEREPSLRLCLALPCPEQDALWPERDRLQYREILSRADEVWYAAERYIKSSLLTRDRYMVEHSTLCLCYLTEMSGGTAYTASYALRQGLEVVNLAMLLDEEDPII